MIYQEIDFQRLLALINLSLFDKSIKKTIFYGMTIDDWDRLIDYSQCQGVIAVSSHAFEKSDIKPPLDQLMQWMGQAAKVEKKYAIFKEKARTLALFYRENNINMLILKGLALSYLYPWTYTREFSDLDIYTFDKYNESNAIIEKININVSFDHSKHAVFDYCGVHVENHKFFLDNSPKVGKEINRYLSLNLAKHPCEVQTDGWLIANAEFNAVFLLRHMCVHFATEGIALRNILDWALFLRKEIKYPINSSIKEILINTKMHHAWNTFTIIAGHIFEMDFSNYLIEGGLVILQDRIESEILYSFKNKESNYCFIKRFFLKTQRLFSRKWVYSSGLIPDNFWTEAVWGAVKSHVKSPKFI